LLFFKSFIITQKHVLTHFGKHEKVCCLYKMKQSHWLLCVAKSCDWSRKITPLSNLMWTASRERKTYSKSRIQLQNPLILKKLLKKSRLFLSSEQPCEPKILVVMVEIYFAVTVLFLINVNSICYFVVQTFKGPVSSQALSSLLQNQVHGPTTAPITVSVSACTWCMIVILACYTIHDKIS